MTSLYLYYSPRRSGKWTLTLKSMRDVWTQGRSTMLVTRDVYHFVSWLWWRDTDK